MQARPMSCGRCWNGIRVLSKVTHANTVNAEQSSAPELSGQVVSDSEEVKILSEMLKLLFDKKT